MATKKPLRVLRCTTHHHACDCREWRYERMEVALKIIQTWAKCCLDGTLDDLRSEMQDIVAKCKEALGGD